MTVTDKQRSVDRCAIVENYLDDLARSIEKLEAAMSDSDAGTMAIRGYESLRLACETAATAVILLGLILKIERDDEAQRV